MKPLAPQSCFFKPQNDQQKQAADLFRDCDILFLVGAAGSGKTHVAVALALQCLATSRRETIFITRPAVEAGENLGFLPGTVEEKVAPFMTPIHDCLGRIVLKADMDDARKRLQPAPLAYLRGRTFTNAVAILDEAQNCTRSQLVLFLTRLGPGSKLLLTGDPWQTDLSGRCALLDVMHALDGVCGVGAVKFDVDACLRHPLVTEVLKRL